MNLLDARRRLLGRNVYKRTAEGDPAIAQGSLARRYPGITMQGWTEQDSYEGRNLFDVAKAKQLNSWIGTGVYRYLDIQLKPNTAYTLFVSENNMYMGYKEEYNYNFSFYLGENPNTASSNELFGNTSASLTVPTSYTFTTTDNPYYINLYVSPWIVENLQIAFDELLVNMMLVEGSGVLPYEPYTGGKPSPNPDYPQEIVSAGNYNELAGKYEYGVEISGRNLFDGTLEAGSISIDNGVSYGGGDRYRCIDYIEIDPSKTYSIESELYSTTNFWILYYDEDKGYITYNHINTIPPNAKYIRFYCVGVGSSENLNDKVMLNEGSETLPYEPYRTPQTVTLTSDRPLMKWDKLEKRNGQWGWTYKNAEITLEGGKDENWMSQSDTSGKMQFYIPLRDALYPYTNPFDEMFYCNTFFTTNALGTIPNWQVRKGTYNGLAGLAPVFKPGDDIDTIDLFRAFLAENPTTILYVTKEETFVPLSESEQQAMNALYTFRPTTVLSNDCECNMALTYKTKKSLENLVGGV